MKITMVVSYIQGITDTLTGESRNINATQEVEDTSNCKIAEHSWNDNKKYDLIRQKSSTRRK
jgi:hypothetical protein